MRVVVRVRPGASRTVVGGSQDGALIVRVGAQAVEGQATEAALRLIEATKFPVQEMVSHVFPLKDIEKCIRSVGGEIPEMFPTKALINPALG